MDNLIVLSTARCLFSGRMLSFSVLCMHICENYPHEIIKLKVSFFQNNIARLPITTEI